MTKPTVSKHWRKPVDHRDQAWITPEPLHHVTVIQHQATASTPFLWPLWNSPTFPSLQVDGHPEPTALRLISMTYVRILRYGIQKESGLKHSHNRWRASVTFGIVCRIRSSLIRPPTILLHSHQTTYNHNRRWFHNAQFSYHIQLPFGWRLLSVYSSL